MKYSSCSSLVVMLAFALTLLGCKKTELTKEASSPLGIIKEYFVQGAPGDYTIVVSSSNALSVYNNTPLIGSSNGIEAYTKDFSNAGSLSINNTDIPYNGNGAYFLEANTATLPANTFTGKNLSCAFTSTNSSFPSFTINKYSPDHVVVTFDGLEATSKLLDRNQPLTINWSPDELLDNADNLIIVQGINAANGVVPDLLIKQVGENTGTVTITPQELAAFIDCPDISVYVAKGNSQHEIISNKQIDYHVIDYGWTTISFMD